MSDRESIPLTSDIRFYAFILYVAIAGGIIGAVKVLGISLWFAGVPLTIGLVILLLFCILVSGMNVG